MLNCEIDSSQGILESYKSLPVLNTFLDSATSENSKITSDVCDSPCCSLRVMRGSYEIEET
jgi:hypothetical protein